MRQWLSNSQNVHKEKWKLADFGMCEKSDAIKGSR